MKIRHLYSFFADVYASFRSRALFFVRNYSFSNIRQWDKTCFTCNIIPNKRALFPFFKPSNNTVPQTTIKQARFYKPCIYDNQLGFNKPAVVIWDSLFAVFRHLCFNDCLRDIRHIRARSGFGKTHRKSLALTHKQALIKNYCFYDQTTQNYSTAKTRINIIRILHPFHIQNHNYANS